jgi:hypothetical protein
MLVSFFFFLLQVGTGNYVKYFCVFELQVEEEKEKNIRGWRLCCRLLLRMS